MENSELNKIIKSTYYQSEKQCEFMEIFRFKSKKLGENSFVHYFDIGPLNIVKAFRYDLNENSFEILEDFVKQKGGNILIKVSPNINYDYDLTKKFNYNLSYTNITATKTLIKDLTESEEDIFKSFSENTRYKINRSYREKDRIEIYKNPSNFILKILYQSLKNRKKEKKFETYHYPEIKLMKDIFKNESYAFLAYNHKNELIVSNLYLGHKGKISYFTGSVNTELKNSRAGYQLIYEALKFFKKEGYKVYDFEGLADERIPKEYEKWLGFSKFKRQFSKNEIEYPLGMFKINSKILKTISFISPDF